MKKLAIALTASLILVLAVPSLGLAAFRLDSSVVFGIQDTVTTAPIDDENVSLPYAFSSGSLASVVDVADSALCDADCQVYLDFVQWCMEAACMLP